MTAKKPPAKGKRDTYIHPKTLYPRHLRKLADACIAERISLAFDPDGRVFRIMCAEPDQARLLKLIEEAQADD